MASSTAQNHVRTSAEAVLANPAGPSMLAEFPAPILDLLPVAIYICGAEGTIQYFNRHAAELWGREPVVGDLADRFCGSYRMFRLDGGPLPHEQCPMAEALRTGVRACGVEVVIERPDGARSIALINIEPIKDAEGTVIGALNCFHDITERKQAEREDARARKRVEELSLQLTRERNNARAMMDALPAAVYTTDAAGRITYFNEAAAALWGCRPELGTAEFCGSWKLYWPDGSPMPHAQCPMAVALREQQPIRGLRAIAERPDGTRVAFFPYPTPLFDTSGALVGAINMLVDVSDHDRHESELRAKERRFRALVEASAQIVWTTDADGLAVEDSPSWRAFTGQSYEQWKGCGWLAAVHPEDRARVSDAWREAVASERSVKMEYRVRHVSGHWRWMLASGTPVRDASGAVREWVGMNSDITERKNAERARQLLATIVDSSYDAIVSKDLCGVISSWNRGATRLFGYTADEVIGKPVSLLIPPDRQDEEPAILERIRRGERVEPYETIRVRKDGALIDVSLTVSPVKDADGNVIGASKIARDSSERKRAEEQRDLLVAEMKHRLKNTLATVQAIATQTMQGATQDERASFIARLHALAGSHDLLTREDWNRAPVRHLVSGALTPFKGCHDIVLEGPDVWIDASKSLLLTMAIHELATNAAKYGALSKEGGQVSVVWKQTPEAARGALTLRWQERGGPEVKPPARKGFGSRLIEHALQSECGGPILEYAPEGLTCTLKVEL